MQKLTSEQAEWLITQIRNNPHIKELMDTGTIYDETSKIINQCTEKKFPAFEMTDNHKNKIDVFGLTGCMFKDAFDDVCISIDDKTGYFTHEQFKAFTAGCQKIVDWLGSQE